MSEQQSFTPPDPELETTEFLQDIASEQFLYQTWLEKVATEQTIHLEGYRGRFHTIPQFLYGIPGIANDVLVTLTGSTHKDSDEYMIESMTLATDDYPYGINVRNDHGIFVVEHGGVTSLAPDRAHEEVIRALFSMRDNARTNKELVEYLAHNSHHSVREDIFETIGENDNGIKIVMTTSETDKDSAMTLEITTKEQHPSSALVGTRLTMYDSLDSARLSDASMSVVPNTEVSLDVSYKSDKGVVLLSPLTENGISIPIKQPKKYHEAHIVEALFALEQAAKAV